MTLALLFLLAAAQADSAPKVTVSGAGKVEKLPTALQVLVPIYASGEGTAKALEALEGKRAAAAAKFKALGVEEKGLEAGKPSVMSAPAGSGRRQAPALRLRKKKDDGTPEKEVVLVTRTLTAQIPLRGKDLGALLAEAEELKAKVKAAGFAEAPKEGEDEALAAALAQIAEQQAEAGIESGLVFSYTADADEKDRAEAAELAMAQATKLAELGARAAKGALGGVLHVEVGESGASEEMEQMWRYYGRRGLELPSLPDSGGRLAATSPDGLAVSVTLKVTFGLKK